MLNYEAVNLSSSSVHSDDNSAGSSSPDNISQKTLQVPSKSKFASYKSLKMDTIDELISPRKADTQNSILEIDEHKVIDKQSKKEKSQEKPSKSKKKKKRNLDLDDIKPLGVKGKKTKIKKKKTKDDSVNLKNVILKNIKASSLEKIQSSNPVESRPETPATADESQGNNSNTSMMDQKIEYEVHLGLNILIYFQHKLVSKKNKLFYLGIILLLSWSVAFEIWDIIIFSTSSCNDNNSKLGFYVSYCFGLIVKLGMFNHITSEIQGTLQYNSKFAFMFPIACIGLIVNSILPLIVFDYVECKVRSPFITLEFGYFITNLIAMTISGVIGLILVIYCSPIKCKIPIGFQTIFKHITTFIAISTLFILTTLFLIISFSQIDDFSRTLLTENLIFWILILAGAITYVLKKKYNIIAFRPLNELETEYQKLIELKSNLKSKVPEIVVNTTEDEKLPSVGSPHSSRGLLSKTDLDLTNRTEIHKENP